MKIPDLQLSLGQLAWTLNLGQTPPQHLFDRLRYLRQIGIPFDPNDQLTGTGNRLTYSYEDLIECGLALYAMDNGLKPKDLKLILVKHREALRPIYREALACREEGVLHEPWVKKRGLAGSLNEKDISLRLHDRYSKTPGKVEVVINDGTTIGSLVNTVEIAPDGTRLRMTPLSSLAIQWTAWALEAPIFKTGPKS